MDISWSDLNPMTWGVEDALDTITGAKAAEKAANRARADITAGRERAESAIGAGYGIPGREINVLGHKLNLPATGAYAQLDPMASLYDQYIGGYGDEVTGGLNQARAQLGGMQAMQGKYPSAPNTQQFSFDMEADPVYQFQQQQMENALARRMAASGQLNSSDMNNALARGTMELAGNYGNDMFNRAMAGYGLNYGREMDLYGAGVNRSNTMFDRANQNFGNQMSLANNQFDRYGSMVGLGAQGKTGLANLQMGKGNALANLATGAGTQLSNINMDIGGLKVATSPLNTLSALASTAAKFA